MQKSYIYNPTVLQTKKLSEQRSYKKWWNDNNNNNDDNNNNNLLLVQHKLAYKYDQIHLT